MKIYASPNPRSREELWNDLSNMNRPWVLTGDINDYLLNSERRSMIQIKRVHRSCKFSHNISRKNLIDLGWSGPKLIWTNNSEGWVNIMLDSIEPNATNLGE